MMTHDTIAAVATAAGRAGIGIIRLSGIQSEMIAQQVTQQDLPKPRYAARRHFYSPSSSLSDQAKRSLLIDSGLLLYFPAPHSYTGETVVEFHIHGAPVALSLLLEACTDLGARLADPGEFTQRAFFHQRLDLAQAEAVADLINASSQHAARSAARSLRGAFSKQVHALSTVLIEVRAQLEAGLDFSDEAIEFITHEQLLKQLESLSTRLDTLKKQAHHGVLLRDGVQCVLIGEVNVGKSSLLNALSGEDAAIVTDYPGTTRDTITRTIFIGGVPFHCIDTAGLRITDDPVEQIGIARTHTALKQADLMIQVYAFNANGALTPDQSTLHLDALQLNRSEIPIIKVINKSDYRQKTHEAIAEEDVLWISAKYGDGLEKLRERLLTACGWNTDNDEGEHAVFMARSRHIAALNETHQHVQAAIHHCNTAINTLSTPNLCEEEIITPWREEVVAEELRLAHLALQKIVGIFDHEDLLGEIFGKFCIGK